MFRASAERTPDRFAFRDTNTRLTYGAARQWVDAIAQELDQAGIRSGDRVSIWLPSRIETALIFFACSRMGYVCNTSLHRDYTCNDILALLKRAGSAACFAQSGYGADAAARIFFRCRAACRVLRRSTRSSRSDPASRRASGPSGSALSHAPEPLPPSSNPDRIVYLAFTSGTTGQPKGVMHSDNTILANARAIIKDWGFDRRRPCIRSVP